MAKTVFIRDVALTKPSGISILPPTIRLTSREYEW
jgi:hypothetical protein